jgi:hypothetical protein
VSDDADPGAVACRPFIRDMAGSPLALALFATTGGELVGVAEITAVHALLLAEELVAAARRRIVEAGVTKGVLS